MTAFDIISHKLFISGVYIHEKSRIYKEKSEVDKCIKTTLSFFLAYYKVMLDFTFIIKYPRSQVSHPT